MCKYGDRLTIDKLTEAHLCKESTEDGIKTCIYQVEVWHKKFPDLLNVVVIFINMCTARCFINGATNMFYLSLGEYCFL